MMKFYKSRHSIGSSHLMPFIVSLLLFVDPALAIARPLATVEWRKAEAERLADSNANTSERIAVTGRYVQACARRWGSKAWQTAACKVKQALVYATANDSVKAIELYKEAIPTLAQSRSAGEPLAEAQLQLANLLPIGSGDVEADRLFQSALAFRIALFGEAHAATIEVLVLKANRLTIAGNFSGAEPYLLRAETAGRGLELPSSVKVQLMAMQGKVAQRLGRYAEAEQRLLATLREIDKSFDRLDPARHIALTPLMLTYRDTGKPDQAEAIARQMLDIWESKYGPNDSRVAIGLNNLAAMLPRSESAQAEKLLRRTLAIDEAINGVDSVRIARTLGNLADRLFYQQKYSQAGTMLERSLAINRATVGENHPNIATDLLTLANIKLSLKEYATAERLTLQAIAIRQKTVGEHSVPSIEAWRKLGDIYAGNKRWRDASAAYQRSGEFANVTFGPGSLAGAIALGLAAGAEAQDGRHAIAWKSARSGMAAFDVLKSQISLSRKSDAARALEGIVAAAAAQPSLDQQELNIAFEAMQMAASTSTSASVIKASARLSATTPAIESLVRQQQVLTQQVASLEKKLDADRAAATRSSTEALTVARQQLVDVSIKMNTSFPRYAELSGRLTASFAELAGQSTGTMKADEAILQMLQTEQALYVMLVSPHVSRLRAINLPQEKTTELVSRLRLGLRLESVISPSQLPVFDMGASETLYRALMMPFKRDLARSRTLYVIPDGPLASIPLSLLISRTPKKSGDVFNQYSRARYLMDDFDLAVLPAPSSLVSARKMGRASRADRALLAFADPALLGEKSVTSLTQLSRLRAGVLAPTGEARTVSIVCRMRPLPETRDEAQRLAAVLGLDASRLMLGRDATEAQMDALNKANELARYRVLLFATHGLVAGEVQGVVEPSLVLSPVAGCATESAVEDGLLNASEVAALTLDADWVILSGCNTASADSSLDAAPMTGLAKSFIYAGARQLLVSHWSVDSDSASELIMSMFLPGAKTNTNNLREAMMKMRNSKNQLAYRTHPAFWAPFVVVGARQ